MYFCGLKGMMPGITEMLEGVCTKKGLKFEEKLKEWKKAGQWHVEVCAPSRPTAHAANLASPLAWPTRSSHPPPRCALCQVY